MLLRRITKHVKDQNWFAVFIDFIIVVVGVFIGIQVANWNEERQLSEKSNMVHQRIVKDFGLLEEFSNETMDINKRIITSLDTFYKALVRGRASPEEDKSIKYALRWGRSYSKKMLRSPTYIELLSSGQLSLINNETIRNQLAIFDQAAIATEYNFRSIHNTSLRNFNYLVQYAELEPVNHSNPDIRNIAEYDFDAMSADEQYIKDIKILLDLQSWFYSNIESHYQSLIETKSVLLGEE